MTPSSPHAPVDATGSAGAPGGFAVDRCGEEDLATPGAALHHRDGAHPKVGQPTGHAGSPRPMLGRRADLAPRAFDRRPRGQRPVSRRPGLVGTLLALGGISWAARLAKQIALQYAWPCHRLVPIGIGTGCAIWSRLGSERWLGWSPQPATAPPLTPGSIAWDPYRRPPRSRRLLPPRCANSPRDNRRFDSAHSDPGRRRRPDHSASRRSTGGAAYQRAQQVAHDHQWL
jgi:hypothetical protein